MESKNAAAMELVVLQDATMEIWLKNIGINSTWLKVSEGCPERLESRNCQFSTT
jgi:hypothetical protein